MVEQIRVVVEYVQDGATPAMRWERTVAKNQCNAFELLGEAFEIVQRHDPCGFEQAMRAFLKGAMLQKEDLAHVLAAME